MKVFRVISIIVFSLVCVGIIFIFEIKDLPVGSSIAGIILGFSIPSCFSSIQDLTDTTNWKSSQRQLLRGGIIKNDTMVRISFAYLYRIKIGNHYLLVKNARGTGKYQPVGGVYTLHRNERLELKNRCHVIDDNKVPIDESSRCDYRFQMPCRYLRKFVKRFNSNTASRERIDNVSREFVEELGNIVDWNKIKYRYCGRHITALKYSDHFQCYEMLLADIVELLPSTEQRHDLEALMQHDSGFYRFATAEEIKGLGIAPGTDKLEECIADHSAKILQENEQYLIHEPHTGECFEIMIR